MAITSVTSPAYAAEDGNSIRCTVTLSNHSGDHSYLAVNGDATSQAVYDALKAGTYGAISAYVPPVATEPQLRGYANAKANGLRAVTRTYTLSGDLTVLCDATAQTGVDLNGLLVWGQANTGATTNWVDNNGGVVTLTGAQCVALAEAVLAYGQSVFAVLAAAMNGISNITITTTAEIDALAWPA